MEIIQTEYPMAFGLTAACLLLGLLLVCVPRPRRSEFPEDAKRKKKKSQSKARKK